MAREQQRHDISNSAWEKIRPYTIGEKGTRGGMPEIPGSLSMGYSGFCAPEHLCEIYRKPMETGRMYTAGSVDGVTKEFGKGF